MSKNQILVRNIKHLTDARYFAAMGVDWMSMELNSDPASFMKWHTLKDWVEGVKLAAEINTNDESLLAKTIIDAKPDGIVTQLSMLDVQTEIPIFFDRSSFEGAEVEEGSFRIISYDPSMDIKKWLSTDQQKVFLQSDWTGETLEKVLMMGYAGGICFSGGEEDATGMRDYELMDELLGLMIES